MGHTTTAVRITRTYPLAGWVELDVAEDNGGRSFVLRCPSGTTVHFAEDVAWKLLDTLQAVLPPKFDAPKPFATDADPGDETP